MREIILAVSYWVHLIATVVWFGGIVFILFVAMPSAKKVLGTEAGKMTGEISKRFTPMANYSIIFLVTSVIPNKGETVHERRICRRKPGY